MMAIKDKSPAKPQSEPDLSCILRWPSERARDWTYRFARNAGGDEHVDALVAIGSSVRPAAPSSSDLDLLLIYHGARPRFSTTPVEVDLRCYQADEVDDRIAGANDLLGWAVRFGEPILERRSYWSDVVDRWRHRVPLPPPRVALERAVAAGRRLRDLIAVGDEDAALEQLVTILTHLARARLIRSSIYPASRPELPGQLLAIGEATLARQLSLALHGTTPAKEAVEQLERDGISVLQPGGRRG
jgi:predicted nucleotidyltransferase